MESNVWCDLSINYIDPEMMNVNRLMHSSLRHFDGEMNMNRPIRGLQRTMAFEEDNGMRRNRYPSGIYVPRRRSRLFLLV